MDSELHCALDPFLSCRRSVFLVVIFGESPSHSSEGGEEEALLNPFGWWWWFLFSIRNWSGAAEADEQYTSHEHWLHRPRSWLALLYCFLQTEIVYHADLLEKRKGKCTIQLPTISQIIIILSATCQGIRSRQELLPNIIHPLPHNMHNHLCTSDPGHSFPKPIPRVSLWDVF